MERICKWEEQTLSKASKEVLLTVVVQAIASYAMSYFELPNNILNDIRAHMSKIGGRVNGCYDNDHMGLFRAALIESLSGILDSLHTELLSLKRAIWLAFTIGFRDVMFERDSLQEFQFWDMVNIQRVGNDMAHTLARNAHQSLQQQI
ncbi:hypothetical protein ACH5RR_026580 [Cinchona calisaya]|uniref:Uncharacterized protein n=1 Tax=Cinchona calisaya TaxID=153742 RepID=A0ABD2Z426_9GENT